MSGLRDAVRGHFSGVAKREALSWVEFELCHVEAAHKRGIRGRFCPYSMQAIRLCQRELYQGDHVACPWGGCWADWGPSTNFAPAGASMQIRVLRPFRATNRTETSMPPTKTVRASPSE